VIIFVELNSITFVKSVNILIRYYQKKSCNAGPNMRANLPLERTLSNVNFDGFALSFFIQSRKIKGKSNMKKNHLYFIIQQIGNSFLFKKFNRVTYPTLFVIVFSLLFNCTIEKNLIFYTCK
jgi:hypothetical protein